MRSAAYVCRKSWIRRSAGSRTEATVTTRTGNRPVAAESPLLVSVGRSEFPVVGFDVDGSRVESLRAGHSFLTDVTDTEVTSLSGAEFQEDPAVVAYHDPFVPSLQLAGTSLESQELTEEVLVSQDCVVILTAHPSVDYPLVADVAPLVFDARGATMGIDAQNVVRL